MYRKTFKLSAEQMANEPIDQYHTNLLIMNMVADKERLEAKHGSS